MCMATHRQPTADEQPGGKGWIGREKPHNIGFASIFDNNRVFGCTKDTGSMSVCIRIEGSDGKWWQGKTMFCIQNKRNLCFRWQRLAVLCIRFFQNKESGCKAPKSKAKTYIPKHRKQGFWWQVFRFGGETYIHNCFKQDCGRQTKRVFGLFCLINFSNTLLIEAMSGCCQLNWPMMALGSASLSSSSFSVFASATILR